MSEVIDKRVPVLIVSGWLGAGKTTMLEHLIKHAGARRYGVLVNDMAAVNVDAATLSKVVHSDEEMIEFSNGCICCTLRADFVKQMAELAACEPKFDALLVESSGISEPQQVAEAFDLPDEDDRRTDGSGDSSGSSRDPDAGEAADDRSGVKKVHETDKDDEDEEEDDEGEDDEGDDDEEEEEDAELQAASAKLREHARLDCTVTVVDALNFMNDFQHSSESLKDRGQAAGERDERQVAELLAEQVEFADVIIINKVDLVGAERLASLHAILKTLNPSAVFHQASHSAIDASVVINCKAFSLEKARASAGWLQSLAGTHVPESIEFGISHCVFRARRPFHPGRLYRLLFDLEVPAEGKAVADASERQAGGYPVGHAFRGVVRSKGIAWMAAQFGVVQKLIWAQAGRVWKFSPGTHWLAALPREEWDSEDEAAASKTWDEHPHVGDREQELVLIGVHMDVTKLQLALNHALVTETEWDTYCQVSGGIMAADAEEEHIDSSDCTAAAASSSFLVALAAVETDDWKGGWDFEVESGAIEKVLDCHDDVDMHRHAPVTARGGAGAM